MLLRVLFLIGISTLAAISSALAEWSAQGEGILYYTDDAALFSATRRSNIDGDPTQPVLDVSRTGFGSDMLFEPRGAHIECDYDRIGAYGILHQAAGIRLCR